VNDSKKRESVVLGTTRVQASYPQFLLASQSETRRVLLQSAGLRFACRNPGVDEAPIKRDALHRGLSVDETALALAHAKVQAIADAGDALVLGGDQILALGTQRFDKPTSIAQARAHLLALRGRTHVLHTACVLVHKGVVVWQHVARPSLTMRAFSDEFLDAYLDAEGTAILSCVGAYRLEGIGAQLFASIEGEQSAILGIPMLPLLQALRDAKLLLV